MFVIPAIDIIGGKCVRLAQGDFNKLTTYGDDPVAIARQFAAAGAQMLHIVDLDGARAGQPVNQKLILKLAATVETPIQVGGGIRSYQTARDYLGNGIQRILLSTAAIEDPDLIKRLIKKFGADRVVIAADIKNGRLATDGWTKSGGKAVMASIAMLKQLAIENVLVTDVSKDGLLGGPNFALTSQFIDAGFQTIGAGGVSSLSDIKEFNKLGAYGVVVGKAVYEGRLDLKPAQVAVNYRSGLAKRIIPCLDVKAGRVVKGTNFKSLRDAGDPVDLARKYSRAGADELVFLDIAATQERRRTLRGLVKRVAAVIDIPFTVGGGIDSLQAIRELLLAGADKVSIGSAAVLKPGAVRQAANYFGSQCIVISVDAKQRDNGWEVYIRGGCQATGLDAISFCRRMEQLGAGELLVNSLDRDGMNNGFDLELLRAVTASVNIPVIASSGGGSPAAFMDVFKNTTVEAALGASLFHYKDKTPRQLKVFLADNGVEVRL